MPWWCQHKINPTGVNEVWYKPTHWLVNSRNPNNSLIRQLTNSQTCQPHQLKNLTILKAHQLKKLPTYKLKTYQLKNLINIKLINSQTQNLINSQTHHLKTSSTQKLKLVFLFLQNLSNFHFVLAKI